MKKILLFALLCLANFAYAQKSETDPYAPPKDALKIELLKGSIKLKVGQTAYLSYTVHGSVGIGGGVEVADEAILKTTDKHLAYHQVQVEGKTGADKATETLVFQALKEGKTLLVFRDSFRGKTENIHRIKVTVTK